VALRGIDFDVVTDAGVNRVHSSGHAI